VAVVQISKIQVRRGQKNQGLGLPQLASGELGWAIDTQELYIGNGSLTEGAPMLGNTKILTARDNIFKLGDAYAYKEDYPFVQTGSAPASPTNRSLQDRLDDVVSIRAFGCMGDPLDDVTEEFQRAIDQLFINNATKGDPRSRVVLNIEPGTYTISKTIYIPPYATIVGAGVDKTIIDYVGIGAAFITVNDLSQPGLPALDEVSVSSATTYNNQPRSIRIENLTIQHADKNGVGIHLSSCRQSIINNIKIKGSWVIGDSFTPIHATELSRSVGILLDSLSSVVKTSNITITNTTISNFTYGTIANQYVIENLYDKCTFHDLGRAVVFGAQLNSNTELPCNNIISNSTFNDIHSEAIKIDRGRNNLSTNNTFRSVGNYGGNEYQSITPILDFNYTTNETVNDYFHRTDLLRTEFVVASTYIAEVKGNINHQSGYTHDCMIYTANTPENVLRLPAEQNQSYTLEYYMFNQSYDLQRTGILTIACDKTGADKVYISDSYDQVGDPKYETITGYLNYDIHFSGEFINDGTSTDPVYSIYLRATSDFVAPTYFRYKLVNHKLKF